MTSTLRLSLSASAAILAWFASSASQVDAKPCVQFDASWNLYAFGGSEDVSLGQNTTWGCEYLLCAQALLAVDPWGEGEATKLVLMALVSQLLPPRPLLLRDDRKCILERQSDKA